MKKNIIIMVFFISATAIAGFAKIRNNGRLPYETTQVQRGDIVQEVSASGKVESAAKLDLQFKNSGKLTALNVKIGEKAAAGQLLAKQDIAALEAKLAETQAGIEASKAKLAQIKAGASPEDIKVSQTKVSNAQKYLEDSQENLSNVSQKAQTDLTNAYSGVKNVLYDSQTKADDSVAKQTDDMFSDDFSGNPQLAFTTLPQLEVDSENQRLLANKNLATFKSELDNLSSDYDVLDKELTLAETHLTSIRDFLLKLTEAVNSAAGLSSTLSTSYKTSLNTARANINTGLSNLNSQTQTIASQKVTNKNNISSAQIQVNAAQSALGLAQAELTLLKAPARAEDVALAEAQIKQSEAAAQTIKAQLQEMLITAPTNGIITDTNGEVGEIIAPGAVVVSLMPAGNLQLKVDISEANIVNIKIGQETRITLDAFGNDFEWEGKVVSIDPAETIISGAVYYKTTVLFDKEDAMVRSGMTANVWIRAAQKPNAIFIPKSAVKEKEGKKFVEVLEGNQVKEKEVRTGIKGEGGVIEIVSGLNEGEKIIVGIKKQ